MKKHLPLLLCAIVLAIAPGLHAASVTTTVQPVPVKIAEVPYQSLPSAVRIENSGIYAISTFLMSGPAVSLVMTDGGAIYAVGSGGILKKQAAAAGKEHPQFSVESYRSDAAVMNGKEGVHTDAMSTAPSALTDNRDGSYSDAQGRRLSLKTMGRNALSITSDLAGTRSEIRLPFRGDLAYAELIGIDAAGRMFLLTERYVSEIPLNVLREVAVIDANGVQLSVLEIPDIKYLSTDKDFRIDADGNLYHMMTTADRMIILKWSGLTEAHTEPISYPAEYAYSLHFNEHVTANEAPGDPNPVQPSAISSRTVALRMAESFAEHQYVCTATNLTPTDKAGPDGDLVRTPSWLLAGTNAKIPYMWGGFSTLAQFDAGLKSGKYAGDINTAGVSGYAVGVDCSGFVSRCWQMSSHYSTSMMPGISTKYVSWDSLRPGDGILYSGSHVRMFVDRTPNGGFRVIESSAREWDVSYWTYAASDLQKSYVPCSYNSMEKNYSFQRPMLTSVLTNAGNTAALSWTCDTTGLLGYRIYASTDGATWTLFADETTIGNVAQTVLAMPNDVEYFRIASVKNDGQKTESDWSNAMGASRVRSAVHYLIVDGYERLNGSYESPANTFAVRYGAAAKAAGITFSTVKNYLLTADTTLLSRYDGAIWFLCDESLSQETFSDKEQALVKAYLESGKKLFVTGSEVGYDLSGNGSATDKAFYADYLKAVYKADNAGSNTVKNESGGFYGGATFPIGQMYAENYPDEIDAANGSVVCMRYDNNKAAGVQYAGVFGTSTKPGKVIYLAFALETAGDDAAVNSVIKNAVTFFEGTISAVATPVVGVPASMELEQNYPNPFNPSTTLAFTVPAAGRARLTVYNVLGQQVAVAFDGMVQPGVRTTVRFDASRLASGMYLSRLEFDGKTQLRKMHLIR